MGEGGTPARPATSNSDNTAQRCFRSAIVETKGPPMNVGMQLREAREARGLSLDSLASATRIKVRILEGLERNDLSAAPPRPYTRGFVAAYAREVGLDADQIARSYF